MNVASFYTCEMKNEIQCVYKYCLYSFVRSSVASLKEAEGHQHSIA